MKPSVKEAQALDADDDLINQQYSQLDRLFEHRTRLTICALLSRYERIVFSRFKQLLKRDRR